LVGPYIAGAVKDRTGSFSGALMPMAIMLLVAIVLPFITHKPERAPVQGSVPA
jgi:cyanate permease